jgi:DNA-binding MarR family transcriptional regulator
VTVAPQRSLEAATQMGRSFKGALTAMRRMRARETQCPGELSDAQYGLLFGLQEHDSLSARDLALQAGVSPATATEMLEGLEAAGLVSRVRSEIDRRVVLTSLTERGRELVDAHQARYEPRWHAAFASFSEKELLGAAAVLDRVAMFFDELAEERQA